MKSWTVDEMLLHRPCLGYDRDRLLRLWNGKDRLTVLEILDLPIPARDRVWAVLQDGPHVDGAIEKILTRCITNHALHCGVPFVEKWATDWLSGADRSLESARAAADASEAATRDACLAAAGTSPSKQALLAWVSPFLGLGPWSVRVEASRKERELKIADIRTSV